MEEKTIQQQLGLDKLGPGEKIQLMFPGDPPDEKDLKHFFPTLSDDERGQIIIIGSGSTGKVSGEIIHRIKDLDRGAVILMNSEMTEEGSMERLLAHNNKDVKQRLLTMEEMKQADLDYHISLESENPHHGYSKPRNGTNKKYIKRKPRHKRQKRRK